MIRYIIKRCLLLIPILIAVSFVVYFIVDLAPGDSVDVNMGQELSVEEKEEIREEMGLNDPVVVRYARYMGKLLQGDLGQSSSTNEPVFKMYMDRLPATIQLAFWGIFVALIIAVPLGVIAATRQNTWADTSSMLLGLLGLSIPNFWLGLLLIIAFSLHLHLFPSFGNESWRSIILPAITVGTGQAALLIRTTRSAMLEVIRQDYLCTARAKGVSERQVIYHHALRNALIPIITAAGTQLSVALGGAVVTESVFAWPGIGRMTIDAIYARDEVTVVGCIMLTTMLASVLMLFIDIIYAFVDPRIRARYSR